MERGESRDDGAVASHAPVNVLQRVCCSPDVRAGSLQRESRSAIVVAPTSGQTDRPDVSAQPWAGQRGPGNRADLGRVRPFPIRVVGRDDVVIARALREPGVNVTGVGGPSHANGYVGTATHFGALDLVVGRVSRAPPSQRDLLALHRRHQSTRRRARRNGIQVEGQASQTKPVKSRGMGSVVIRRAIGPQQSGVLCDVGRSQTHPVYVMIVCALPSLGAHAASPAGETTDSAADWSQTWYGSY